MKKRSLHHRKWIDLDLGWKTRYSDFAKSSFWRLSENYSFVELTAFLKRKVQTHKWFDLEMALQEYASVLIGIYIQIIITRQEDYRVFEELTNS